MSDFSSPQSNNLVIHSMLKHFCQTCSVQGCPVEGAIPHIITCSVEHDSIRLPLEYLVQEGAAGECWGRTQQGPSSTGDWGGRDP